MKYIAMLTLTLAATPLFAGPYCINNSQNLKKPYDTKTWHSVECYCGCEKIKNNFCPVCGHLQNAHPLTIVEPNAPQMLNKTEGPQTVKETMKNLIQSYRSNH